MNARYGWIVNNFLHDLSSGLWAACLLVIWRLSSLALAAVGTPGAAAATLGRVADEMFLVMLASLLVIFVTGGIRLRYWRKQGTADELQYRRRALIVKHVVYLVVYGAGTVWAFLLLP